MSLSEKKRALKRMLIRHGLFLSRFGINDTQLVFPRDAFLDCTYDCVGKGNQILCGGGIHLNSCEFYIHGNNNRIQIDDGVLANGASFWIEDDNNVIRIKKGTTLSGKIGLSCIEGTTIEIGERCLFSSNISFQTGDAHSILNFDGKRINPSQSIVIGNHVWVGKDVLILKGAEIPDNSIVGARSLVTKNSTLQTVFMQMLLQD